MRIAYLNPQKSDADRRFAALAEAGRGQGADIVACANEVDIAASNVDFVLSASGAVPKMVDLPSYLIVAEPKQHYLESQFHMRNLMTYDGFVTSSDNTRRFLTNIEFGIRRHGEVCFLGAAPDALEVDAKRLLAGVIDLHARRAAARPEMLKRAGEEAHVSVIVRCGGRDLKIVQRAVNSIASQTFGRFTVIFVKYRPIDLSSIRAAPAGRIAGFLEVDLPGGGRSETLFTGLRHVATPYFTVLDDDDWWMRDHMETMFAAGRADDPAFDVAYSGVIAVDYPAGTDGDQSPKRSIYQFGMPGRPKTIFDVTGPVAITGFVARSDLLAPDLLQIPEMNTAHDSALIALLCRRKMPVFSYRATAFYTRGSPDGSGWATHPGRGEEMITFQLRSKLALAPSWLMDFWSPLPGAREMTEAEALRAELTALHNTLSWRITAPLRWLKQSVRGRK